MLNDKPVWTFAPNWEEGVLERLEWLTDVLASATGVEQRRCMRLGPRREFESSYYITARERQMFDISMFTASGAEWYIPLWAEVTHLSAPLATGSATLPVDPADREYRDGDYVLLIGRDAFSYEIVQVLSSTGGALQLVAPTQQEWPRGTKTYPLRLSRLREAPTVNKKTDNFVEVRTVFRLVDANDAPADPGLDTYLDIPVLTDRPDESEDLSQQYQRLITELDSLSGSVSYRDMAAQGITTQSYRWVMANREEYAAVRRVLHLLRGRWRSLWLPTFFQDMTPSRVAALGDTELYVHAFGYTVFGGPTIGRDTIMVTLRDGTHIYAKITGSSVAGAEEVLTLDAPLAQAIDPADVLSVSFMTLCRMDADQIELDHKTDAGGLTVCVVTFKSTHAPRTESGWSPAPLTAYDGSGVSCMPPCGPATFAADAQGGEFTTGMDYNPVTNEIWWQSFRSADPLLYGYRLNPTTMEVVGELRLDPGILSVAEVGYPGIFFFDVANDCVWFWVKYSSTTYLVKVDIHTGATLAANAMTISRDARFWTRAADNTLWCIDSVSAGFSPLGIQVREINRGGLTVAATYTKASSVLYSGSPESTLVTDAGDVFFATYYGSGVPVDFSYFRTGTRTFGRSDYSDVEGEAWTMVYCTGRDVIYGGDSFIGLLREIDCTTGNVTGKTIKEDIFTDGSPWTLYDGSENHMMYDAVLDVIWSFDYYNGYDSGGKFGARIVGMHVETGEVYGAIDGNIDPDPGPNMNYLWGAMVQIPPSSPRAFFMTGGFDDGTTTSSGIWKIPMCKVKKGRNDRMFPAGEWGPASS